MGDACATRVEEHGDGGYELTGKDHKYTLPPIESNSNRGTTQCPISKGQPKIKGHEIPPSPVQYQRGMSRALGSHTRSSSPVVWDPNLRCSMVVSFLDGHACPMRCRGFR